MIDTIALEESSVGQESMGRGQESVKKIASSRFQVQGFRFHVGVTILLTLNLKPETLFCRGTVLVGFDQVGYVDNDQVFLAAQA